MSPFITRWLVTTIAVAVVAYLLPGRIEVHGASSLLLAALMLGIANALLRPILLLLSLPFILVTLGFFILVVNALMLWIVGSGLIPGFQVNGFWSAFFGSILISLVSWPLSAFFKSSDGKVHVITHHPQVKSEMKQAQARVVE
ncbi:MAG: phage holin family protein [Chthoniobacteraceae bacterium]